MFKILSEDGYIEDLESKKSFVRVVQIVEKLSRPDSHAFELRVYSGYYGTTLTMSLCENIAESNAKAKRERTLEHFKALGCREAHEPEPLGQYPSWSYQHGQTKGLFDLARECPVLGPESRRYIDDVRCFSSGPRKDGETVTVLRAFHNARDVHWVEILSGKHGEYLRRRFAKPLYYDRLGTGARIAHEVNTHTLMGYTETKDSGRSFGLFPRGSSPECWGPQPPPLLVRGMRPAPWFV